MQLLETKIENGVKISRYDLFPMAKPEGPVTKYDRNNVPIGTVLKLHGYSNPSFVLSAHLNTSCGLMYEKINLKDFTTQRQEPFCLRHISEKADNRIQVYILDEMKTSEELAAIKVKAAAVIKREMDADKKAAELKAYYLNIGRPLAEKYLKDAPALIMAYEHINDSDLMTDYWGHKTVSTVVLGASKHKRNLFPELRKAASKFEMTRHLVVENEEFEHRENYSMGAGTYLKDGHSDSTGWSVEKNCYVKWDSDEIAISLAKCCLFQEAAPKVEVEAELKSEKEGVSFDNYKGFPIIQIPMSNGKTLNLGKKKVEAVLNYIEELRGFIK